MAADPRSSSPIDVLALLASTDLFRDITPDILRDIEHALEWVHLSGGDTLMRQGEPGDCLFLLAYGRLRVVIPHPNGSEVAVGEIARGEIVGEMAVLTAAPRSATVRAVRDSRLLKLSKDACDRLLDRHPQAMMQITRQIVQRLQLRNLWQNVTRMSAIAVVPAGRSGEAAWFSERFVRALARFGSTLRLSSAVVDGALGAHAAQAPPGPEAKALLSWLHEQEMRHAYLVYEADAEDSQWTRRCLRQADRVLAVGRGGGDPDLSEAERGLHASGSSRLARTELVLVHAHESGHPAETRRWLTGRRADGHHHVRGDSERDFARLARLVTGRAVGVVLGGGGGRALAHVGALRALEEAGVPVDAIGGTSMGAGIAALHAMGADYETKKQACKAFFGGRGSVLDFTAPIVALTAGARMSKRLAACFGDRHIEDLWLRYFCVSSNLSRAEMVVHREGPVWKQVRASVSLPGIFPPVCLGDDLLVDGALMNNLPVDVMRAECGGGTVLAVDVTPKVDLTQKEQFGEDLSGWRLLADRLNPFAKRVKIPHIVGIMMRATELASANAQNLTAQQADLCLFPPVQEFGLLSFKSFDQIIEIGYRHTVKRLEEWLSAHPPSW